MEPTYVIPEAKKYGLSISIFGHQSLAKDPRPLADRAGRDSDQICFLKAASDSTKAGHRIFKDFKHTGATGTTPDVKADGLHMNESGQVVLIRTGDCPVVAIRYNDGSTIAFHAGFPALTPKIFNGGSRPTNIVDDLLVRTADKGIKMEAVFIVASICGECYHHDFRTANIAKLQPFVEHFGQTAFADDAQRQLQLTEIVASQLRPSLGNGFMYIDQFCTKEHPALASNWAGHATRNVIVVAREK